MASVQEFASKIKAKYPQYQDMEDSVLAEKMLAKFPQYRDMVDAAPAAPAKKPLTLATAAAPSLGREYSPTQITPPMSYGALPPDVQMQVSPGQQQGVGLIGDALSLPTRAAGTGGGLLGYSGATGGKRGLDALADPETGLLRPARQATGGLVRSGLQGGEDGRRGLLDYGKMAAGGLGYLGASVLEDPFTLAAIGAKPIAAGASAAGRGFKRGAQFADRIGGRLAEEASGVPEEALRAYGTKAGRAAIEANAGKEFEIGQDLVRMVENFEDYIPEKEAVNLILERMPGISPEKALAAFRASKSATTLSPGKSAVVDVKTPKQKPTAANLIPEEGPARNRSFDQLAGDPEITVKGGEPGKPTAAIATGDVANKKIDDLMERLKLIAGEDVHTGQMGKIPAKKYRDIRASYDTEAKAAFKKDERELLEKALINARNQMAADLRETAKTSGDPEFVTMMESYSDKLDKLERVKKFLGQNADTRETRAEGFIANLLNANKTAQQNLMGDLESIFDADLMTRIKGAKHAKQIGKDGKPAILPRQVTGRSNLAQTVIGAVSIPFSSPALASRVTLPALRKLANARSPAEKAFYIKALRKAGATAAEIEVAASAADALQAPNAIPFRKVAERDQPQPVALRK